MKDINKLNDEELSSVAGGLLTPDEALTKALEHAGLKRDQVNVMRVERDREYGVKVYEIKFYQGGMEFDYDVNAETGAIMKFEKDRD